MSRAGWSAKSSPEERAEVIRLAADGVSVRRIAAEVFGDSRYRGRVGRIPRRPAVGALRWDCVDLAKGVIRVEQSYDPKEKTFIDVKSAAGNRNVPIAAVPRDYLLDHKITADREEGLVFGRTPELPTPRQQHTQPRHAVGKGQAHPDPFHEARHTFASLMIAAERQRERDLDLRGPRGREDHARHLRAPDAQQRGEGAARLDE